MGVKGFGDREICERLVPTTDYWLLTASVCGAKVVIGKALLIRVLDFKLRKRHGVDTRTGSTSPFKNGDNLGPVKEGLVFLRRAYHPVLHCMCIHMQPPA